jgi:EpsI family protein
MHEETKRVDIHFWISVGLLLGSLILLLGLKQDPGGEMKTEPPDFPLIVGYWRGVDLAMDKSAIDLIRPDAYVYRNYHYNGGTVNVFIGHYETLEKSDLAHSPLVCYPGQGWQITGKDEMALRLGNRHVELATMKVQRGTDESLVMYGYKADQLVTGSLFKARLHLIKGRILNRSGQSAFIRFSTDIIGGDVDGAENLLADFIRSSTALLYGAGRDDGK